MEVGVPTIATDAHHLSIETRGASSGGGKKGQCRSAQTIMREFGPAPSNESQLPSQPLRRQHALRRGASVNTNVSTISASKPDFPLFHRPFASNSIPASHKLAAQLVLPNSLEKASSFR
jgi:hypothetical protein